MRTFNSNQLLDQLEKDSREVIEIVKNEFVGLDVQQLNWKPSEKEWSILECIDHMSIGVEHYLKEVDLKLRKVNGTSIPTENFKSGLMGNYFVKMMTPTSTGEIKGKMDTFKKFKEFDISNADSAIDKFLNYQEELIKLLQRARSVNIEKVRVKSAIGGWLMFRLGDAFRFVVGHNQRHIIQAQGVYQRMPAAEAR